jgi:hypothetical protein
MEKKILEKAVEDHFCARVISLGGIAEKFRRADRCGVPDRLVLLPGNRIYLVELKWPGESARADQLRVHREYLARGTLVPVLSTVAEVDVWIESVTAA